MSESAPMSAAGDPGDRRILMLTHTGREEAREVALACLKALIAHGITVRMLSIEVDERLIIEIQDDGVGIDMNKLRKFGNGLNNMKKRMASIEGGFHIENHQGTKTSFYLEL